VKKKQIVFCDFDGTITEKDNIVQIMKQFAPPEWEAIKDNILSQQVSIQAGVGEMFTLLPSDFKNNITDFVLTNAKIRDGFTDFVSYLRGNDIPFYVLSGGIDFFVHPLLEKLDIIDNVYCNGSDFSGKTIKILWPHSCDKQCSSGCGCCKPSIIRKFPAETYEKIVIGDSITDLAAARIADKVYARSFLLEKSREEELPYSSFETFYDILEEFQKQEVRT
jgi:2-hydroxy-3-keto-5-methylthiopentenyl-1-phosphate phosphatase